MFIRMKITEWSTEFRLMVEQQNAFMHDRKKRQTGWLKINFQLIYAINLKSSKGM